MPRKIIWSPLSELDFATILEYLELNWNTKVVAEFINKTDLLLHQIALNPKQFPLINRKRKVRKCVITKHNTLYYRISKNSIDLLRIYDTRQNPKKLKYK